MVKGWPTISPRTRETMMLGEVPIWVISPPSRAPKDIGIRKQEGDAFDRFAIWKAIGIMMASAPTFFTKAERMVTVATSTNICAWTELTRLEMRCSSSSGTPVWAMAPLTTRALATMMTISSLKPLKASSGFTRPATMAANSARQAVMS